MTSTKPTYNASAQALACLRALEAAGHEAWLVGGCVRDMIMGVAPHDFDVTTSALPAEIKACFEKTIDTGIAHGTVTALIDGCPIEITTYRSDGKYLDGRHPESVKFVRSIDEDLARRDFTMNAICWNQTRGIYDPYNGQRDIEEKFIRAVGDPKKRFQEDALRILRAARFVSQLGFDIEDETYLGAYRSKAQLLIGGTSNERITTEIDKLLQGEFVLQALLDYPDLIEVAIPEITSCRGFEQHTKYHAWDVWGHTAHVVESVKNTQLLRWAALCHDLGKPSTFFIGENGQGHFYGHAIQGKRITSAMMERFSLNHEVKSNVITLVERHNDTLAPTIKSIRETIAKMNGNVWLFRQLLALKRADSLGHAPQYREQVHVYDEIEALLDKLLEEHFPFNVCELAIDGADLIDAGFSEGPQIGEMLAEILQKVQIGEIKNNKDDILGAKYVVNARRD